MQVEPQASAPSVLVTTAGGGGGLEVGRQVVARVIEVTNDGSARISLAGHSITVQSDVALRAGQTLNLTVAGADDGRVRLSIDAAQASPAVSQQLSSYAPNAINELARAGVAVTPQLAQAAARAIEALAAGGTPVDAQTAARSIASLVARDLAAGPAAGGRVAAALDLAGKLGAELHSLAAQSREVANALPTGSPTAAALRGVLAPGLSPAELALARIVQSTNAASDAQAAHGARAPIAATPTSSPAVVANYVASQVAGTARLDDLARASWAPALDQAAAARMQGAGVTDPAALARHAQSARLRGEAAAEMLATPRGAASLAANALSAAAVTPAQAAAAAAAPEQVRANATAAAAAGSAGTSTPPPVARAVAELATALTRFASALAPGQSAPGMTNRGTATDTQPPAGTFTPQAAGGSASGASAPLVASMREALAGMNAGQEQRAAQGLIGTLARHDTAQLASALGQLSESQTMQLAGSLLDLAAARAGGMAGQDAAALRHAMHNSLADIGRALAQGGGADDQAVLRAALELVAANDPRPAVAEQASRLLHAMDGQQLLSQARSGADPGYVYFQLPLPGNRAAEVLVRRDPGRRQVTFDSFDIAFLLDTESLGSLMVHLDAHPSAVRATIKTEHAYLEPFLAEQAVALQQAVEPEARRPVLVSTGVFEGGKAPASLLEEPALGLIPGENAFYA